MSDQLPHGWLKVALEEVLVSLESGSRPKGGVGGIASGVPSIGGEHLARNGGFDFSEIKFIPEGFAATLNKGDIRRSDILIVKDGATTGKVSFVDYAFPFEGAFVNEHVFVCRCGSGVEPKFVFYSLFSESGRTEILKDFRGAAQGGIGRSFASKTLVPVAPLREQRRVIAEIERHLTRLGAAEAALKRVRANLKRYRASVLKAACEGQLVPTEAELARAEGGYYEPAEKLLARILKERRARWEADQLAKMHAGGKPPKDDKWKAKYKEPSAPDSTNLPSLPEGWVWARWEQVGFSQNGRSFPSKEYQASGVKLLRPGNLHIRGFVDWAEENTRFLPKRWEVEFPGFIVGARELVMNLTAQSLKDEFLGRVCMTRNSEHCLLNQRIARLTPIHVLPEYLLWMFKSEVFRRFVDGLNTGSLIQHMFTSQLARFCLPLPPLAEQHRIVAEVERRLSVIDELEAVVEANLKRAERLRQAILKRAFEGKLVPQDPNDEPASVLLERIRAERQAAKPDRESRRQTREIRIGRRAGCTDG